MFGIVRTLLLLKRGPFLGLLLLGFESRGARLDDPFRVGEVALGHEGCGLHAFQSADMVEVFH